MSSTRKAIYGRLGIIIVCLLFIRLSVVVSHQFFPFGIKGGTVTFTRAQFTIYLDHGAVGLMAGFGSSYGRMNAVFWSGRGHGGTFGVVRPYSFGSDFWVVIPIEVFALAFMLIGTRIFPGVAIAFPGEVGTSGFDMTGSVITAIATPPGQGAISLIRLSGTGAIEIARSIFSGDIKLPRTQNFGKILDSEGRIIDEVLLTAFRGPASFTGEDVVEISCHGGLLVTQRVLERVIEAGARPAEPGEFSQRAFLNGKMDLTQAEAVMDLISAKTDLALKAANEQLSGRLGSVLMELREELIGIIAQVEAYIDFPEEDIDPETGEGLLKRIESALLTVDQLIGTADQGRILREGVRTVICGAPNVGKSSLLNVLLGFDRAIVSETAGTTRDTIEEVINLRGIPLRLVDTAGVRESEDAIELEGINRTQAQIENAELILEVVDGSEPGKAESSVVLEVPDRAKRMVIVNKADLVEHDDWKENQGIRISCAEPSGIDALSGSILEVLGGSESAWGSDLIAINVRHKNCLGRARDRLRATAESLRKGNSPEFAALELREALDAVGEVVGTADVEEILGEIFASFCIGK